MDPYGEAHYCRECRAKMPEAPQQTRGRPRMYCSQKCRQRSSARGALWVQKQLPARRF
jgi:hypothetical protein